MTCRSSSSPSIHSILRSPVRARDRERIGIDDEAVEPAERARVGRHAPRRRNVASGTSASVGNCAAAAAGIPRRSRPHFVAVHEQDEAIDERGRELGEPAIACVGGHSGGHRAAGERLEPQQQPVGIVGDVEHERPVGCANVSETERPLEVVRLHRQVAGRNDAANAPPRRRLARDREHWQYSSVRASAESVASQAGHGVAGAAHAEDRCRF